MTEDTDTVVELEDDKDQALQAVDVEIDAPKADKADPAKANDAAIADSISELKRQLEAERAQRNVEANGRRDAEARAAEASRTAETSRGREIDAGIDAAKRAHAQALAKHKAALTEGDYDKAGEAQTEIANAQYDLRELDKQKTQPVQRREEPTQRQDADPVEEYARQLEPRSAAWVRSHPEYVRDPSLRDRMLRADSAAWGEGIERGTDAYYGRVEELLGLREPPVRQETRAEPKPARVAPVQAPVNRESRSYSSGETTSKIVRLSPEMREIARANNMSDAEYAKYYWEDQQEQKARR